VHLASASGDSTPQRVADKVSKLEKLVADRRGERVTDGDDVGIT
jgi:hypothetical protein